MSERGKYKIKVCKNKTIIESRGKVFQITVEETDCWQEIPQKRLSRVRAEKMPCWQWQRLNCNETALNKSRISQILTWWQTTTNKNNVRVRQAEQISNTFLGSQIKFSILFAAVVAAVGAVNAVVNIQVFSVDMNTEFLLNLQISSGLTHQMRSLVDASQRSQPHVLNLGEFMLVCSPWVF